MSKFQTGYQVTVKHDRTPWEGKAKEITCFQVVHDEAGKIVQFIAAPIQPGKACTMTASPGSAGVSPKEDDDPPTVAITAPGWIYVPEGGYQIQTEDVTSSYSLSPPADDPKVSFDVIAAVDTSPLGVRTYIQCVVFNTADSGASVELSTQKQNSKPLQFEFETSGGVILSTVDGKLTGTKYELGRLEREYPAIGSGIRWLRSIRQAIT